MEGLEPPFHEAHKPRKSHPGTTSSKAPWDPWDPRRDWYGVLVDKNQGGMEFDAE